MRSFAGLILFASGLVIAGSGAHAAQSASHDVASMEANAPPAGSSPGEPWQGHQGAFYPAGKTDAASASDQPSEKLGTLASHPGPSILNTTPKVGPFKLTFYSDMPVTGFDGMSTADVVISLTRKF